MSSNVNRGTAGRLTDSPNRLVGAIFGAVYLLVGLLGFAYTGFSGFVDTNTNDAILGLFEVNVLHNIAHLLIGGLLLFAALQGVSAAKGANTLVGAVYLLLGLLGFFIAGDNDLNILSLNQPDNFLHLASAAVLLGVGLTQDKNVRGDAPGVPGV